MALTTLFLDLNSYFASVEQQLQPGLRGRPVVVTPVEAGSGCCIAASYEAKAFGIRTGTRVGEARRRCPEVAVASARHGEYVRFHLRIIEAVETCIPVAEVHSIDEVSCRLDRRERTPEAAAALALRIKGAIRERVGECLRCSVGVAPNTLLAKVGTDMRKPDGLVVLRDEDLPHALYELDLTDLPGIAGGMERRLNAAGIRTVEELCARSKEALREAWGSVLGVYWWHWLRGHEVARPATRQRSVGHSHVLAPELRNEEGARAVIIRLLHKAAARMRHLGYEAGEMTVSVRLVGGRAWEARAELPGGSQDTLEMIGALGRLWARRARGPLLQVGVTLAGLGAAAESTMPLFPEEERRRSLARAIDRLNARHGRLTVYTASMQEARASATGGIAFANVPDLGFSDTVA